jgi:SnoaL-like domain
MVRAASVTDLLRDCLASGELERMADAYAPDAVLDASLPGARRRVRGAEAIAAALGECFQGPGRVVEWLADEHPEGVALWLERTTEAGAAARQRHYMHLRDGHIERHWIYAARPRSGAPPVQASGDSPLFEGLGTIVERATLASSGWSGNRIDRLVMDDGRALIAKRIVPGSDWLGRATSDDGREALLHLSGVLGRMPPQVDPAVVAAERDGDAWWVVAPDVSEYLLDERSPLSREQNRFILGAAAAMWDAFWGEDVPHLASQADRLAAGAPAVAERERDGLDILPKQLEAAWEAFAEAVDDDVADAVLGLLDDPGRLADALDERGHTLIHGDLRDENIGLPDGRLVLLDWGLAARGHPAVELAWYMVHDVWRIEATHDEVVQDFRRAMGERDDPFALELGLLSGLMQYGWIFGHSAVVHPDPAEREWARAELAWWVPRARRALDDWR